MAALEDITVGASVSGIIDNKSTIQVVAVKWHGSNAMTVTYRNMDGSVGEQILFREDEAGLKRLNNQLCKCQ